MRPRSKRSLSATSRHSECRSRSAQQDGSDRSAPGRFDILGVEHLNAAVALGRGVIAYTGHFTTLEIMGSRSGGSSPRFAAMASHRSSPLLEEFKRAVACGWLMK